MPQRINWKEKYNKLEKINDETEKAYLFYLGSWKHTLRLWKYFNNIDLILANMMLVVGIIFGIIVGGLVK